MRQMRPMRRHEVLRLHRPQRDDVVIRAAVAHYAHRFHPEEHGERLRRRFVPVGRHTVLVEAGNDGGDLRRVAQFCDEDRVRAAAGVSCPAVSEAEYQSGSVSVSAFRDHSFPSGSLCCKYLPKRPPNKKGPRWGLGHCTASGNVPLRWPITPTQ